MRFIHGSSGEGRKTLAPHAILSAPPCLKLLPLRCSRKFPLRSALPTCFFVSPALWTGSYQQSSNFSNLTATPRRDNTICDIGKIEGCNPILRQVSLMLASLRHPSWLCEFLGPVLLPQKPQVTTALPPETCNAAAYRMQPTSVLVLAPVWLTSLLYSRF
jgi:hypothetical protein